MTFWDRQAKRFDKEPPRPEDDEAMRRALAHLASDARVLEIGCAAGAHARAMRPHVTSWHGIDTSREMIRLAQRHEGDGLTFQQAVIGDVGPDGYTAVVAFNVLHFMDLPDDVDRIADLLPPGGLLLAQTPCLGDVNRVSQWLAWTAARLMRIEDLHALRFDDLRAAVERRFEILEASAGPPGRTWIAARKP